jgi:hypothetical protein
MNEGICESGGTAPSTSIFGTSRGWVVSYTPQPRYHLCPLGNRLGAPHSRSGRFVERSNLPGELIQAPRSPSPQSSLHISRVTYPESTTATLLAGYGRLIEGRRGSYASKTFRDVASQFCYLVYLTTLFSWSGYSIEFYDNELEMASTTCTEHNIQDPQEVSIRDVRTVCASSLTTSTQIQSVYRDDS